MENNLQNNYMFKGNINKDNYFEIFGFLKIKIISDIFIVLFALVLVVGLFFSAGASMASILRSSFTGVLIILVFIQQKILWNRNSNKSLIFQNDIYGKYDEQGIEWNTGSFIKVTVPWVIVQRYMIRKKGVVLYYGFNQKILIHKSFFTDENEWSKFKEVVKSNAPKFHLMLV